MVIKGALKAGRRTKDLVSRLAAGDVALIDHADLDEMAAKGLLSRGVSCVLNASQFCTGRYPNPGPQILLRAGVHLVESLGEVGFQRLRDGDRVEVCQGKVWRGGEVVCEGRVFDEELLRERHELARKNLRHELDQFVKNTLEYVVREKDLLLASVGFPPLKTAMSGRHVLVVVRGHNYEEDLAMIRGYVREIAPVLIGVDGGADALLEFGLRPDIIVGDMDSVSDRALRSGAELIVHAYPDGTAPGMRRLEGLGLRAQKVPLAGTSEDLALLLAYEQGASLIVIVGSHSNMVDFLEKGRSGMASTFLTRLKVGHILVDAKGVSKLYAGGFRLSHLAAMTLSALVPLFLISALFPPVKDYFQLLLMRILLLLEL